MIRVPKGVKPAILQKNGDRWNKEYCKSLKLWKNRKIDRKPIPHYNHKEIKDALKRDFHGKCAYCESDIAYQQFGDIEHFRPKEKFCLLIHEWENLLLSCEKCNNKKRAKFPTPEIINPMDEDPESTFEYEKSGNMIHITSNDSRGQTSIRTIGLNREYFIGKRKSSLQKAEALICLIGNKSSPEYAEALNLYTDNSSEFAGLFRFYLQ